MVLINLNNRRSTIIVKCMLLEYTCKLEVFVLRKITWEYAIQPVHNIINMVLYGIVKYRIRSIEICKYTY